MLPQQLNFAQIKPRGYSSNIKICEYLPSQGQGVFNSSTSDNIRFVINTDGYWNPYMTYICVDIEADKNCKIDGSVQSIFQSLIISSNSQEIERIDEYDQISNILYDLNYDNIQRNNLYYEGLASRTPTSLPQPINQGIGRGHDMGQAANGITSIFLNNAKTEVFGQPIVMPCHNMYEKNSGIAGVSTTLWAGINTSPVFYKTVSPQILNQVPFGILKTADDTATLKTIPVTGGISQVRKFNIHSTVDINYIYDDDYTNTLQIWDGTNCTFDGNQTQRSFKTEPYNLQNLSIKQVGFEKFGCTSLSPQLDYTFGKPQSIYNGGFKKMATGQTIQRFYIPIMSSIFGILLPRDQYKYIPLKYFPNLTFEFRLNPYAMYSSGYEDALSDASLANVNQKTRNYTIKRISIKSEQLYFDEQADNYVQQQVLNGKMMIQSIFFQLGPQSILQDSRQIQGTWQINLGHESLKNVLISILSNDYLTYNFCRKNYRLSGNITSMQFKFNNTFIPQKPIEGHGGNYIGLYNNGEFIMHLKKSFGRLWDTLDSNMINAANFSLNVRPYDVTDKKQCYINDGATNIDKIENISTHMSMPVYWETNFCGKAIYSYEFDTMSNDQSVWSGINTTGIRPWNIMLQSDQVYHSQRPCTIYFWMQYDGIFSINDIGKFTIMGK